MRHLYVPDVGDGLAAGIRTISGPRLQIDCGSQNQPKLAFEKGLDSINPNALLLSHFHLDHYNWLLSCDCQRHRTHRIQHCWSYTNAPTFLTIIAGL
ncbi:MAG: MBL fold metallo-hydrolase [Desulfomonilaceae bacterium]